jgi:hypothetical protein
MWAYAALTLLVDRNVWIGVFPEGKKTALESPQDH